MYGTEKLHKFWLFYGTFHVGVITPYTKSFTYYVNATQYDPEQLLFQIHRRILDYRNADGTIAPLSPDALIQNPDEWLHRAIIAVFRQYWWEKNRVNMLIAESSIILAFEKTYSKERIAFSKCGINFTSIQRRSLKKLTPYPEAIDIK